MTKIFVIGDLHLPYVNKKALNRVYAAIKREKPTHIVQIGDLYDQYAFSKYSKKNLETPEKELRRGITEATRFWLRVQSSCKRSTCYQLFGNHDVRRIKRAEEKLPTEQETVRKAVNESMTFKGVKTIYDDKEELVIAGIIFQHGHYSKLGDHCRYNGQSTVCGHSHTGGVVFTQYHGRTIFELNAGYLADQNAEPLMYRPSKTSKWTLGYGLITFRKGIACPQFIPIEGCL